MVRMSPALRAVVLGAAAAVGLAVVLVAAPVPPDESGPALVVPVMFVLAGLLGPVRRGSAFTCTAVALVGTLHLVALGASALALAAVEPPVAWHVASQVLFVAGFGMLVPLAAGYPGGPAPRWTYVVLAAGAVVPALAAFSGPTPGVLGGAAPLRPIAHVLPGWVAEASAVVFLLPAAAVAVGVVRMVRGDRALRRRLAWPLAALGGFAVVIAIGAAVASEAGALATALFLVASPLVPVGLIAGSRAPEDAGADVRILRRELRAIAARLDAASLALPGDADGIGPGRVGDLDPRLSRLTARETAVLALLARGRSNPAIARELHVSLSAVEKHVTSIFQKLELPTGPDTHRRVAASAAYLSTEPRDADPRRTGRRTASDIDPLGTDSERIAGRASLGSWDGERSAISPDEGGDPTPPTGDTERWRE
ncbi:hypothetical protein GCM10009819_26290 [Agromyces tropicus]|uniref:HTH luxR-type domain-containing protein n=1 Tax=Agromyces tropicus TaxID=555371 RepID=A0ABP5G405_9MICO